MKTHHVCELRTVIAAATSLGELERLAGVCDRDILRRAAGCAFRNPAEQWAKLLQLLKRRIRLRYESGELLDAERLAHARWCGEWKGEVA